MSIVVLAYALFVTWAVIALCALVLTDAGGAQQLPKLGEVVSGGERGDAERPLLRAPRLGCVAGSDLADPAVAGSLHPLECIAAGSAPTAAPARIRPPAGGGLR